MSNRTGLTKRSVDALVYSSGGPAQQILYDAELPAFGLRVYPSGKKSFILRYRTRAGQLRFKTIGRYGVFTLDQARKEARRLLLDVGTGGDPVRADREQRRAASFAEFAKVYIDRHAKPHKKTWREDQQRLDKRLLPAFRAQRLADLRRPEIHALHLRIGAASPAVANRYLAQLSKMFELAIQWGYLPEDARNPAKGIKKFREQPRDRWVRLPDLPRLLSAADQDPSPYVRAAVRLFLYTGMRRSELLHSKWTDIDLTAGEWRLGETKSGNPHVVPLPPGAVALLRGLPRQKGNPHVFPGHLPGRPMVNIDKPWRRIRAAAGMPDLRIHDLRRTVGSLMASSGKSLLVIGEVLNHRSLQTTTTYARLAGGTTRGALLEHADSIFPPGEAVR